MGHHPFLEEKLTENNKIATTNDHEGDGERVIHAIHQAQGSLSPLQQRGGGWVRRSSGLCSRGAQCWAAVGPAPATLTGPFTFRLRSCGFLGPGGLSSIHIRVPCWCICESITDKQWRRGGGEGGVTHTPTVSGLAQVVDVSPQGGGNRQLLCSSQTSTWDCVSGSGIARLSFARKPLRSALCLDSALVRGTMEL